MEIGGVPAPIPPTGRQRPRVTVRGLMLAVAGVGVSLWLARGCARFIEERGEPYYATTTEARTFDLGAEPRIAVDCFAGRIAVYPAPPGATTVEVVRHATANTRGEANAALGTIRVQFLHRGDLLRVAARDESGLGEWKMADVTLRVPPGAHLDLRTGCGSIDVGMDDRGATPATSVVVARSIRARNDSLFHSQNAIGNINIHARGPTPPGADRSDPIRLQLDACGKVVVRAERAAIEATAWLSEPPPYDRSRDWYDAQPMGLITFDGSLAEGDHRIRAARRVAVRLAGSPSLRVQAAARGGPRNKASISGNIPGPPAPASGVQARWAGTLGDGSGGSLTVRVDDGSIVLDREP